MKLKPKTAYAIVKLDKPEILVMEVYPSTLIKDIHFDKGTEKVIKVIISEYKK